MPKGEVIPIHTRLSPSGAHRWMNCPGSVDAAAGQGPGEESGYAAEGTAAHALLEVCLRTDADPIAYLDVVMYTDSTGIEWRVTEDMANAVGHALDWVRTYETLNPEAKVYIEHRVNPGSMLGREDLEGTADVAIDNFPHEIVVMDYKHGAGKVVEVEDNEQTLMYALGMVAFIGAYPEQVRCVITQPRARHEDGPVREHVYTRAQLKEFAKRAAKAAARTDEIDAPRKAGDWCKWCPDAAYCRTLTDFAIEQAKMDFTEDKPVPKDVKRVSDKELAKLMHALPVLEVWIKALYGRALATMLDGKKINGWKLVQGRKTRKFKNEQAIIKALARKFEIDDYMPRELLSVAKVEQLYKKAKLKKEFEKLLKHIMYSEPNIHIAKAEDPREEYKPGAEFKQ